MLYKIYMSYNSVVVKRKKQQGIALILCLVLAAVFAAISIYTSEKQQQQLRVFMGLQEKVSQRYLAKTLMEKLHFSILTNQPFVWQDETIALNGHSQKIQLPHQQDHKITISIQDAGGLISILSPNQQLLINLIDELAQEPVGQKVMDAWGDWQDSDNLTRLYGREKDTFQQPPYLPRNANFQSFSELRLIEHMNDALFEKLKPHLIFFSPSPFSPNIASDQLRQSLDLVELSQEQRKNQYFDLVNGLRVDQKQTFKVSIVIEGTHSRFKVQYVVTYRPDEIRLVSISDFGD